MMGLEGFINKVNEKSARVADSNKLTRVYFS